MTVLVFEPNCLDPIPAINLTEEVAHRMSQKRASAPSQPSAQRVLATALSFLAAFATRGYIEPDARFDSAALRRVVELLAGRVSRPVTAGVAALLELASRLLLLLLFYTLSVSPKQRDQIVERVRHRLQKHVQRLQRCVQSSAAMIPARSIL